MEEINMNQSDKHRLTIMLDDVESIPVSELDLFCEYSQLLEGTVDFDSLLEDNRMSDIELKLDKYVRKQDIILYHFTRGNPDCFRNKGLCIYSGEKRRKKFLDEYGDLFSSEQIRRIKRKFAEYYTEEHNKFRENKVWFTMTANKDWLGTVEPLYKYYGGEIVNFALSGEADIMEIFETIGQPLVITCKISTEDIVKSRENMFGKALLSTYHKRLNPNASWRGADCFCTVPVTPQQIVEINDPGK
jgi:hypothetical protein